MTTVVWIGIDRVGNPLAGSRCASHITGAGATARNTPWASVNRSDPSLAFDNVMPASRSGMRTAGVVAGLAFNTRLSVKPSALAVTVRSTFGNTFAYVAVDPDSVGAGRLVAQSIPKLSPFGTPAPSSPVVVAVASAVVPPPFKASVVGVATVVTEPLTD